MKNETLAGYVVDIACLRKYPLEKMVEKAREHTRECLLMGHCIESGYGLVTEEGGILLLDTLATQDVVSLIANEGAEKGNRIEATREHDPEEGMRSIKVRLVDSNSD